MTASARRTTLALLVYVLVLATAAPFLLYRLTAPGDAIAVEQALFSPNVQSAAPVPVSLPHEWRDATDDSNAAWYRLSFELQTLPSVAWTIVLPTVRYNVGVTLNQVNLGTAGRMEVPVARNARKALAFSIPAQALRPGANEITIELRRAPDGIGYLDYVIIGPDASLRPRLEQHNLLRVTLPKAITALVLLMSIVIGVLAYVRRGDREYLYYCLGTLVWAVHSSAYFLVDIPVTDRIFDWLRFSTMGFFAYLGGVLYVHRYLKLRQPFLERRLLVVVLVAAFAMALLRDSAFYFFAYYVWHPFCLLIAAYGLLRMLHRAWSRADIELHVISSSALALFVFGNHDLLTTWGIAPWHRGYVLHYAMAYALALFCAVLLKRFVGALNEAERLNHVLEIRVNETRQELADTYLKNSALENRRVVAEERDRIMRDMHDGMGGQLITTLALIEEKKADLPRVADSLRAALQDLRLMIDSLDVAGEDITTMLGMFRARMEPALNTHNMTLNWNVEPIGEIPDFGSAKALHVLRILQEAVTNAIKHSQATQVWLSAKDRARVGGGRQVIIEVRDNGVGLQNKNLTGRGMSNMKSRALNIGAMLDVQSDDHGTQVLVRLSR
ncbi:MAG: ATP-binding protein [Gammaproteobacteria bacterium]